MEWFTSSDGISLAYTDAGEGQPLLCLAGLTRNGRDFDYLAPHLEGVRLIRPDYRGRGASHWADPASYTVPREARDAVELLDHLGLARAAVLGTSRGGLVAMMLAVTAKDRLAGVMFNDIGPVVERKGLEQIFDYIGRNPKAPDYAAAAAAMPASMPGFGAVPEGRWREEVERHYIETPGGLVITYDPALRGAFLAAFDGPEPDLWPLFDALEGLPVGLLHAFNSDILGRTTAAEMRRRRPDMIFAEVPERGHIPFLDEVESLAAIRRFLELAA